MKRLNRKEEAVSPVIATILMVAITVVLAATLYMMVGDIGGDDIGSVAGSLSHRGDAQFEFTSLATPSSAETDEVEITLLNETDGQEEVFEGDDDDVSWSLLSDGEVAEDSRFTIDDWTIGDGSDDFEADVDEVIVRIDGYSGTISYEM